MSAALKGRLISPEHRAKLSAANKGKTKNPEHVAKVAAGVRSHGQSGTPTYRCWRDMLGRCLNPNRPAFKHYGGRGITVCDRWRTFENFLADMGIRPTGLSLDRRNNEGNYEPENCRWATAKEQRANQRPRSSVAI